MSESEQQRMEEQDKIEEEVSNLFDQADNLLFKQRNYDEARQIYDKILELQPTNVDAINSLAYCVKYMAASGPEQLNETLFTDLEQLYQKALQHDPTDIEANFNLGLLYLQFNQDPEDALKCFKACVARDDESEDAKLYDVQFAKSYYNIGMIYDKMGQIQMASSSYLMAMTICRKEPQGQLIKSATYKKAGTNYAVTLEKLGQR